MYLGAVTGSESSLYLWVQNAYIFTLIGLVFAALVLREREHRYWKAPVVFFGVLVFPVLLQTTLIYEIRVNQTDIIVDEPIHVDVVLKNPTPFWVWSQGYRGLSINAVTVDAPNINLDAIAESASALTERGPVRPFEERVIRQRRFMFNETGKIEFQLVVEAFGLNTVASKTVHVTLDPFIVDQVQLNPNGAKLPFMMFKVTNQGECAIVQLNAKVDNNIMPWSFGVDHDNRLGVEEKTSFKVYTQWYDPTQKEIVGFTPQQGFPYQVTVKARYEDGETRTRTIDVIADQHSYLTTIGVDTVQVGDTSLLTTKDYSTLAFSIENGWTEKENLRLSKIHVYLNSSRVMVVDKWVPFGGELAVSSILEDKLEIGELYNVTIVSYSTTGEISKNTEFIRCEPYIVQRIHLLY